MIGRQLAHFKLLEEIGSGAMGVVYRAHDLRLHRMVAVKTLDRPLDEERRRRFLSEARAASALNHPAIVTIYEVGSEGDVDFIAMELVAGRSLADELEAGPLDLGRVHRWSLALARALAVAHRAGVIHRDLKPANVMVGIGDELKVLDFGLAKRLPSASAAASDEIPTMVPLETAPGAVLGTPAYMSPEQATGREADGRSDLFSLGCIVYEMLTGHRPFAGRSAVELMSAILRDEPPAPSRRRDGVSPAWDAILARLLAKDPDRRYENAEALATDLERLAPAADDARPARRRPPVRRLAVAAVAVLAVVTLVAVVLAWSARRGSETAAPVAAVEAAASFPEYRYRLVAGLAGSQRQPTLSPDGREVAFVAEDATGVRQIWVVGVAGGEPRQLTSGEDAAGAPFWSARGERIVFHRHPDGIWEVPPAGGAARRLIHRGQDPALSADGRRLVFHDRRRPWISDGDGGDPRPLAGFEPRYFGGVARAAFAPDGERLVVFWPHPIRPLGDLWIATVDGSRPPRRLTELSFLSWGSRPVWTADGRWIVFTSDHAGSVTLWRVAAGGGTPQPVTRGAGSDYSPDLSADLARLIYANGRQLARVVGHDPRTGTRRTLYERRNLLVAPRLSPTGDRVAFFARAGAGFQVHVADLATGDVRQVTRGEGLSTHPRWSADGDTIYYYREDSPELAFHRTSLDSGVDKEPVDEELVAGWSWPVQHGAAPSPDERRLVYTLRDDGDLVETRIRSMEDGTETTLPLALYEPGWTPDGEAVYGATWNPSVVHLCPADGTACRTVTAGWQARMDAAGEAFYTLRGNPPTVWRHELTSGEETELFTVDDYDGVDFGWGIRPDGEVVHHAQVADDLDLWLGEAISTDAAGGQR